MHSVVQLAALHAAILCGPATTLAQEEATPYYTLVAEGVAPEDTALITGALDRGIERMIAYFDADNAHHADDAHDADDADNADDKSVAIEPLLREIDVTITIHPHPTDRAGPGVATTHSGTRDGSVETFYAEIHLLAPSAHPPGLMTSSGEPKDEAYFQRLIVHEYSTIFLELISRTKPKGWRFRQAPAWFVQGCQEYLGLTRAGDGPLTRSLPRYVEIVRAEPDRVTNDFGFDVRDPYITGAVLVHFMHEHFGDDRVLGVLRSGEPTFGRAIRKELGVDADGFMDAWTEWLRSPAPGRADRGASPER